MAIERIYIPTYRRPHKQATLLNLPDHWKSKAILVVAQDEENLLKELYPDVTVVVCPNQGKPPPGVELEGNKDLKYGLSPTREWIAYHAGDCKYAVLDDDIAEFVYTARPSVRKNYRLVNSPFGMSTMEPGFENTLDEMMDTMDKWLDEYVTCGLEVTWNPPF